MSSFCDNTEIEPVISILPSESQLLQKCEVHFSSYEDIKIAIRDRIEATYSEFTPKAVCKEFPDAFIVEGRMNYVIKPISSTIFSVSSYFPGAPCRYGCSYWNYMEMLHDELCEYLDIKYETELEKHEEIENDDFIEPPDHKLVYTQTVKNFISREMVKGAFKYAIYCSYNQLTSDEPEVENYVSKQIPDSCLRIRRFVKEPTKFKIYLYQPNNEDYINPDFTPSNLIYYIEDYRNWFYSDHNDDDDVTTSRLEGEPYYEKQFEDYLRLNPVEEDSSAQSEAVVQSELAQEQSVNSEQVQEQEQEKEQENTLCTDEDIYVYDGIDIYE